VGLYECCSSQNFWINLSNFMKICNIFHATSKFIWWINLKSQLSSSHVNCSDFWESSFSVYFGFIAPFNFIIRLQLFLPFRILTSIYRVICCWHSGSELFISNSSFMKEHKVDTFVFEDFAFRQIITALELYSCRNISKFITGCSCVTVQWYSILYPSR
jgi:hypothetical protein